MKGIHFHRMERPGDEHNLYIVVADDEIEDHSLIKEAIKRCDINYIVTSVYNGVQLMNLLLKREFYRTDSYRAPDVIILDLKMHLMDGFEALKQIKSHDAIKDIPVYVLTVSEDEQDKKRALELGADEVHTKPADLRELDPLIRSICNLEMKKKDLRNEQRRSSR